MPIEGDKLRAPWTSEEVHNLNVFQRGGWWHEFTCGEDSCPFALVATPDGWICPNPEGCAYTQDWALPAMAIKPRCLCSDEMRGAKHHAVFCPASLFEIAEHSQLSPTPTPTEDKP